MTNLEESKNEIDRKLLKGDGFLNRYRIEGVLTTTAPLHLGNGYNAPEERKHPMVEKDGKEKPAEVNAVATDWEGRPVVPGSSLKGVLRSFLLDVLSASTAGAELLAGERKRDYEAIVRPKEGSPMTPLQAQEEQIAFMRNKAGFLERVFGTPFAEGKVEVWDCECASPDLPVATPALDNPDSPPFWDKKRLTYIDQSVAIDPDTKTAIDKKLYHYETVPPGVSFNVAITGQNLVHIELGMLLFGLHAFNSAIWPLTLGGMTNRGFGRCRFELKTIRYLHHSGITDWIENAAVNDHAGYETLKEIPGSEIKDRVADFRTAFLAGLGGKK
jgi:CRISPR/Cas system CSM-associated protein Csm3 (group 7 of RAMP superfamily)